MDFFKRIAITISCFMAAITCYALGMNAGGVIFIVLGLTFEIIFWNRILRRKVRK